MASNRAFVSLQRESKSPTIYDPVLWSWIRNGTFIKLPGDAERELPSQKTWTECSRPILARAWHYRVAVAPTTLLSTIHYTVHNLSYFSIMRPVLRSFFFVYFIRRLLVQKQFNSWSRLCTRVKIDDAILPCHIFSPCDELFFF